MRQHTILAVALVVSLNACGDGKISAPEGSGQVPLPTPVKELSIEVCGFGESFDVDLDFHNPFVPFVVGAVWNYEGEEDGEVVTLEIEVLDSTEVVGPVTTRVVKESEWVDDLLIEESWNFFAENLNGTVCYFGEDVNIYEYDGADVDTTHEGAWRAGDIVEDVTYIPGIFMPAESALEPGLVFQMEGAPGVAEDIGKILGTGPVKINGLAYLDAIRIRESNPIDGDWGIKYYAPGVGLLIDGPLVLISMTPGR